MNSDNDPISSPCQSSRNRAFLTLRGTTIRDIAAAQAMCQTCPLLESCARDALHAGDALDRGWTRPAHDVVQAGVTCHGDKQTARALAKVAGTDVPKYRDKYTRNIIEAGTPCRNCGTRMVPWQRDRSLVPPRHNAHHGRHFCDQCRTQYRAYVAAEGRVAIGLRKQIDRMRHHRAGTPLLTTVPEPAPEPERTTEEAEALEFMLRLWKPRAPRPPRCLDCRRHLCDSHAPVEPGTVQYGGTGLCTACHNRHRPFLRRLRAEEAVASH